MSQDPASNGHALGLEALLRRTLGAGASDLHLTVGQPPRLRVAGELVLAADLPPLASGHVHALLGELLDPGQARALEEERSIDLARSLPGAGDPPPRFRINVFYAAGQPALAIRRLDDRIRELPDLKLPERLADLTELPDGLVLVTGPTGSGKTTTLATLLERINRARACHVITLEDPIEYRFASARALVRQRELRSDFASFADALRAALREDPDVILVGEMRDLETMRAALMAAETGHLVFSTLHSGSAVGATERLIGAFPSGERDAVRHELSLVLRAVVAQRLLPARGGGRVPVVEVLRCTPAVSHLVRAGKTAQLYATMEGQAALGMQTLEQALAEAVARGWVEEAVARQVAREPQLFDDRLRLARRPGPALAARPGEGRGGW